jgi:hypothetical protein
MIIFYLLNFELERHNYHSARCASVSDAISRNISAFKGKYVLLFDFLITLSIFTLTFVVVTMLCFVFRYFHVLCFWLLFMHFLCSGSVFVIGLLALCQRVSSKESN